MTMGKCIILILVVNFICGFGKIVLFGSREVFTVNATVLELRGYKTVNDGYTLIVDDGINKREVVTNDSKIYKSIKVGDVIPIKIIKRITTLKGHQTTCEILKD